MPTCIVLNKSFDCFEALVFCKIEIIRVAIHRVVVSERN